MPGLESHYLTEALTSIPIVRSSIARFGGDEGGLRTCAPTQALPESDPVDRRSRHDCCDPLRAIPGFLGRLASVQGRILRARAGGKGGLDCLGLTVDCR